MRKFLLLFVGAAFVAFMNSCNTSESASDEVQIGNQIWMTKNLNVDKFRNGDPIPEVKTAEEWRLAAVNKKAAWCYFNNDPAIGEKFGRLYNWFALTDPRGLAPAGWHIPSYKEWEELVNLAGGNNDAGFRLKNNLGWWENGNGNNQFGFAAIPGGGYTSYGTIEGLDKTSFFWSTDEMSDGIGWGIRLTHKKSKIYWEDHIKGACLSVRCIKDEEELN